MAKSKNYVGMAISYLYLVGMAITAIGFICPVFSAFKGKITVTGFDMVGKGDSVMKIAALLVFIGAAVGVVLNLIHNKSLFKLIALVLSVGGGLYCFFNAADFGVKLAGKFLGFGFYMIIIGWCLAIAGWLLSSKK